jgi:CubicO group peptidase (beta-lactamase class C family)
LILEAATGHKLGQELARRIFRPLGLRDTFFPVNAPGIPGPKSRGYSLPLGLEQGPLLDFTILNPSVAWAAGALISNLGDLERFFRALLGGRLLPLRLLAAMTTPIPTGQPCFGYGLGLIVIETPAGRLLGHDGSIPGFLNIVLSTEDGRRQVGIMRNEEFATPAVSEAFNQVFMALAMGLLEGAPLGWPRPALPCAPRYMLGSRHVQHRRWAGLGWPSKRSPDPGTPGLAQRRRQRGLPGDILASRTVRELVVGSDLALEDRGTHPLKGVEGSWQLFAMADAAPAASTPQRR